MTKLLKHKTALATTLAVLVAGCSGDGSGSGGPDGGQQQCIEEQKDLPVAINRELDILFVIDTGSSMAANRDALAASYRELMAWLESYPGGLPNLHIAVVSSDLGAGPFETGNCTPGGDGGQFQSAPRVPGCTPPDGAFLSNIGQRDGTEIKNYQGSLADAFACIAELGSSGCDYAQPLQAMRRALDGSNPGNAGFLRDDAFLLVVFVTDKDDCSASDTDLFDPANKALGAPTAFRCFEQGVVCDPDSPRTAGEKQSCQPRRDSAYLFDPQPYVELLRGLKPDPSMVAVAAIVGGDEVAVNIDGLGLPELEAACSTASAQAGPAVRLLDVVDGFAPRAAAVSMCAENHTSILSVIAPVMTLGAACMEGDLDQDPALAGVQHECVVSEVLVVGGEQHRETLLPECTSVPPDQNQELPCWYFEHQPNVCPDTPTQLTFEVARGRASVPSGTHVMVRCAGSTCEPSL